ncbi:MAG: hypothetical protein WDA47_03780 [Bacilli bacterium]
MKTRTYTNRFGTGERQDIVEIDFRESTPCGGAVRYTVDPDTDFIAYSSFSPKCKVGIECKNCTWHNCCYPYKELRAIFIPE